jgi:2,4-dienoyl-CoA reductase-like NADH-dependent reductase (Old Yellow Enzyme family)
MTNRYPRIASLKGIGALRSRCTALGISLPSDDGALAAPHSPLAEAIPLGTMCSHDAVSPNRFAIHPMEGWDATADGQPTELTIRRWRNFGISGAGLIWGGEAAAVTVDGRANPNQLMMTDATATAVGRLRQTLLDAARDAGNVAPVVGLQLTHSGRWARSATLAGAAPTGAKGSPAPRIAFHHPILDRRVGISGDAALLRDDDVDALVSAFAQAARLAGNEGFDFVDLKHCHGYLLHEFLSARSREGRYGGDDLDSRLRLTFHLIDAVRAAAPGIGIGMRLSVFDRLPHRPDGRDADGRLGPGIAEEAPRPYRSGFGIDPNDPDRSDFGEPIALVRRLVAQGVRLINVTAGSPYYVPHVQRPALFPPSDGYAPPEDPLVGVARLLDASRTMKQAVPEAIIVSTGWTYLQEYLPHVAQACVREGWCDLVGLGRMVLSYPELPADVLAGRGLERKKVCRTFSDCTTAPRNGMVSGCFPLDPFYRARPEREALEEKKRSL